MWKKKYKFYYASFCGNDTQRLVREICEAGLRACDYSFPY